MSGARVATVGSISTNHGYPGGVILCTRHSEGLRRSWTASWWHRRSERAKRPSCNAPVEATTRRSPPSSTLGLRRPSGPPWPSSKRSRCPRCHTGDLSAGLAESAGASRTRPLLSLVRTDRRQHLSDRDPWAPPPDRPRDLGRGAARRRRAAGVPGEPARRSNRRPRPAGAGARPPVAGRSDAPGAPSLRAPLARRHRRAARRAEQDREVPSLQCASLARARARGGTTMNRSDWLTDELIQAAFERRAGRAAPGDLRRPSSP